MNGILQCYEGDLKKYFCLKNDPQKNAFYLMAPCEPTHYIKHHYLMMTHLSES